MIDLSEFNILIACEESQTELKEFLKFGANVFSCDIQDCSGGIVDRHIKADVLTVINGDCDFFTCDGKKHYVDKWNLVIAHPPCTYFSRAGSGWLYNKDKSINKDRLEKGFKARDFFLSCLYANADFVVVENPVPVKLWDLPPYDFRINPFDFGEPYSKLTCYWLAGNIGKVPFLIPTTMSIPHIYWCNSSRKSVKGAQSSSKMRSKSFKGIAEAMAEQWGNFLLTKAYINDII